MLNEKERAFVDYWEASRLKEKNVFYQVLTGLPVGLLFSIPIMLILFSGRFWYKRADMVANSQLSAGVLIFAVLLIALFVAVLYKRHQWEMKEQQYQILKARDETKS
jgi:hypothetical protein